MELQRLGLPTVQVLLRNHTDNPTQAEIAAAALAIGAHDDCNMCWRVIGRSHDGAESPLLTAVAKLATAPSDVATVGLRHSTAVVLARCAALAEEFEPNDDDPAGPWSVGISTPRVLSVSSQGRARNREWPVGDCREIQTKGVTGAQRLVKHDCVDYICAALERELEAVDSAGISRGGIAGSSNTSNKSISGSSSSSSNGSSDRSWIDKHSTQIDSEEALKGYWLLSLAHLVRASPEACRLVAQRKRTVEALMQSVAARTRKPNEQVAKSTNGTTIDRMATSSEADCKDESIEPSSQPPLWVLQRDWALFILRQCTASFSPDSSQAVSALASCKAAGPLLYLLLTAEEAPDASSVPSPSPASATISASAPSSVPTSTSKPTSSQREKGTGRGGVVERRRGESTAARSNDNSNSSSKSSLRDVVATVSAAAQQPQPGSPAVRAGVAALLVQCLTRPSLGARAGLAPGTSAVSSGSSSSSEFGRQFFRLALALTSAAQPSASAVARFFPLLTSDDHHAQHIALMVLRRALEGSKPAGSAASNSKSSNSSIKGVGINAPNSNRARSSSIGGVAASSDRDGSSGGSNRASREQRAGRKPPTNVRKQGSEEVRALGAPNGARDLKRAASLAMAHHHAINLTSEVRAECVARGLLPTLAWLLLHAHASVRDSAAAVLESLVFGPNGSFSNTYGNDNNGSSSSSDSSDAGGCCVALMEQGCVPLLVLTAHGSTNKFSHENADVSSDDVMYSNNDSIVANAKRVLAVCHANLANPNTSSITGSSDTTDIENTNISSGSERDRLEALVVSAGSSELRANVALALALLDCHKRGRRTSGNSSSQQNFHGKATLTSELPLPASPVETAAAAFPPAPSSGALQHSLKSEGAIRQSTALGAPTLIALCNMLKSHASRIAGLFALRAFDSLLLEIPVEDGTESDDLVYLDSNDVADVTVVVAASGSSKCPWQNPALSKSALLDSDTSGRNTSNSATPTGDTTSKSLGGVRMSCPPLGVLKRASPWLADLVQRASIAAAQEDAAVQAATFGRPIVPRFAKLFGPYRVWEEVFAHAVGDHASWLARCAAESTGKNGTSVRAAAGSSSNGPAGHESVSFAEAAHRYSLPALLGLLKLAEPYGFHNLAKQYADSVCEVHLRRDTCATILKGAVQSRQWPLALTAFRTALDELEKTIEAPRGGNNGGGAINVREETWIEPLAHAIGDFLCAAFHVDLPPEM